MIINKVLTLVKAFQIIVELVSSKLSKSNFTEQQNSFIPYFATWSFVTENEALCSICWRLLSPRNNSSFFARNKICITPPECVWMPVHWAEQMNYKVNGNQSLISSFLEGTSRHSITVPVQDLLICHGKWQIVVFWWALWHDTDSLWGWTEVNFSPSAYENIM